MKRRDFIRHLEQNGCYLDREGRQSLDFIEILQMEDVRPYPSSRDQRNHGPNNL